MITALIEVECNECGYKEEIVPQIFYRDYSGKTPFIDMSDSYLEKLASKNGFENIGDEKHRCGECADRLTAEFEEQAEEVSE